MNNRQVTKSPWRAFSSGSHWLITDDSGDNDICQMSPTHQKIVQKANAEAIITAVNNTYGAGINPEAVPDMLKALKEAKRMYESVQPAGGWQGVYESIKSAINDAKI